jgi:predicted 3-demethylubiquinone-9 3-methyltransferase (glyoxalase superfamily)
MQKITPFLWFIDNAEEAAKFYTSVFKNSKILGMNRYDKYGAEQAGVPEGTVMTTSFELEGQRFTAINGGPSPDPNGGFNMSVSFVIDCKDQAEVDYYWDKLTADGGKEVQCGWLTDKFGLTWQVVPTILTELLSDLDPKKSSNVMQAMLKMIKIDIADLQEAYDKD